MLKGSQIVNALGKYLKRNLTGSGVIERSPNACTVFIPLSYKLKPDKNAGDDVVSKDTPDEIGTITIQICITTYDNRIGISILNGVLTIDHKTYTIASFDDYETECKVVLKDYF